MKPSALHRLARIDADGRGLTLPAYSPAVRSGRSIFPSRVYDPDEVGRVLKDGFQSRKIGAFVTKGFAKGWPIFTLTLEERATCPRTCQQWQSCFGNNMHAAERLTSGPALEAALESELGQISRDNPRGFMVRLHVLGDFYSLDYVAFWRRMLFEHPQLHVFGFTARLPDTPIGAALMHMAREDWRRFAMRFSGLEGPHYASRVSAEPDAEAILCPAQTGAADCCATCMICVHSTRSIQFHRH